MSQAHAHAHPRHSDGKLSSVRDELTELKNNVHSSAHDAAEHGKRVVHAASAAALDAAGGIRDSAIEARNTLGKTIADRPFTSIAVAAGAGAALMGLAMMWRKR